MGYICKTINCGNEYNYNVAPILTLYDCSIDKKSLRNFNRQNNKQNIHKYCEGCIDISNARRRKHCRLYDLYVYIDDIVYRSEYTRILSLTNWRNWVNAQPKSFVTKKNKKIKFLEVL